MLQVGTKSIKYTIILIETMDILQKQAMWILIVTYLSDCSGWTCIHGNCYLVVSSTLKNWQDALNDCKNNGGELLSITTNTEQQTVQGILGGNLSRTYWIGLSLKAGKWSWSDSCTLTYTNWDKGQPQGKGENCAGIFQATGGKWHDLSCSSKYGYICKSEIDECASNPCIYGTCIDSINSYQCLCNPGYTGLNCVYEIDECSTAPCNNGTCIDLVNGFLCQCPPGYEGTLCDQEIDECKNKPCVYGNCTDKINGYQCHCKPGYTGTSCEYEIDECNSSPCVNGTCYDLVNKFMCLCSPGFQGKFCEKKIDMCQSTKCVHGSCVSHINRFECRCFWGAFGINCQFSIMDYTVPIALALGFGILILFILVLYLSTKLRKYRDMFDNFIMEKVMRNYNKPPTDQMKRTFQIKRLQNV